MANIAKKARNWFQNEDRTRMSAERSPSAYLPTSYFGPLSNFFSDMDRMFDNTFRSLGIPSPANMQMFIPNVDITASDNEYTVTCEVPGMEERDIKLDVAADGTLTISGEKRQESTDNRKDTYFTECRYGSFERTLSLPDDVDPEDIQARFKNGVLTITCPRTESARQSHRQIPISGGRDRDMEGTRASNANERGTAGQGPRKAA
jgi:HSP20 family protein